MRPEFDQIELPVKAKVRFFRNDTQDTQFDHIEMRKIISRKRRHPIWYAKEWLVHKGLRQKDVVARTEMTKSQVSEYLSGSVRWNEDILVVFAEAIGVEPADLLRPPIATKNELADYIMKLDSRKQTRALKLLRAALGDEDEPDEKVA